MQGVRGSSPLSSTTLQILSFDEYFPYLHGLSKPPNDSLEHQIKELLLLTPNLTIHLQIYL